MNEYTLLVQEYFCKRVESFLETFAKEALGINHYYVRVEFAKSCGQIHAHLVAILGKMSKFKPFNHIAYQYKDDIEKQAEILDEWMSEVLGLTAMFPGTESDDKLKTEDMKPLLLFKGLVETTSSF